MDYYYLQKSDKTKVWLSGIKARTRLEFIEKAGYFDFIGNDGQEYTVMDIKATHLLDFDGWSSILMGLLCGALAFPLAWYYGLYAFGFGFIITSWVCIRINCDVEFFNSSCLKILQ